MSSNKIYIDLYFELKSSLGRSPKKSEFVNFGKQYGITSWKIRKKYKNWTNFVLEYCKDEPYIIHHYEKGTICKVKDCNNQVSAKGYCKRHYQQKSRSGYIRKGFETDEKEIVIKNTHIEVRVYSSEIDDFETLLIDRKYLDKIQDMKIRYRPSKGPNTYIKNQEVYLTRFLFGDLEDENLMYSFKNKDTRDLREKNIRIIDFRENSRTRSLPSNNTSGYKGISWDKKSNKYVARIGHNGKDIYLGSSDSLNQAIKLRKDGEIKYWGKIYSE